VKRDLNRIADSAFDVAVVGGGITGAGVARHAALAGLSTVLLEASDFAAGTSSRSTKLIHGGLRYLAMGDVALVRETALERKRLFRMAPHLTEPKWMLVPARSLLGRMKLRLGITAYEMLGAVANGDKHRNLDAAGLEAEEPLLDRDRYPYACCYREYLTDDARLVLATLRGAAVRGAEVCNHVRVTGLAQDRDGVTVDCVDALADGSFSLRARVVVNATGPWAEELFRPGANEPRRLHLSKGVHVGVPRNRLPVRNMVMLTAADGRPVFAIGRGSVTYVGTTDTTVEGGPDLWPDVSLPDVEYLLRPLADHFRGCHVDASDIVSAWAGLRPLINQPGKAAREMSRKEEVWTDGRLITIAGGKLTGFRIMAELVMARVASVLERRLTLTDPLEVLPGGAERDLEALLARVVDRYGISEQTGRRLIRLYGSEVFDVLGDVPTAITPAVFAEELDWAVTEESAMNLEDVVYRRLRVPWFHPEDTEAVAIAAAGRMARHFDWPASRQQQELNALASRLSRDLTFSPH